MTRDGDKVLSKIPNDNKAREVEFFIYGNKNNFLELKNHMTKNFKDFVFFQDENCLIATIWLNVHHDKLTHIDEWLAMTAKDYDVEYDGYSIKIDHQASNQNNNQDINQKGNNKLPKHTDFENVFARGDVLKFAIDDNSFGLCIFVAGNKHDGYFFDIVDNIFKSNQDIDLSGICHDKKLYRQPIMAYFNPDDLIKIGDVSLDALPRQVMFRITTGYPAPDEIDEMAKKLGFDTPLPSNQWNEFLQSLVNNHRLLYISDEPILEYLANINDKTIDWQYGAVINDIDYKNLEQYPMLFGYVANLDDIKNALLTDVNVLDLNNKVM